MENELRKIFGLYCTTIHLSPSFHHWARCWAVWTGWIKLPIFGLKSNIFTMFIDSTWQIGFFLNYENRDKILIKFPFILRCSITNIPFLFLFLMVLLCFQNPSDFIKSNFVNSLHWSTLIESYISDTRILVIAISFYSRYKYIGDKIYIYTLVIVILFYLW